MVQGEETSVELGSIISHEMVMERCSECPRRVEIEGFIGCEP